MKDDWRWNSINEHMKQKQTQRHRMDCGWPEGRGGELAAKGRD